MSLRDYGILMVLLLFLIGCRDDDVMPMVEYPELMQIPEDFPFMDIPSDNAFTHERWALGKKLFFDRALSIDGTISCGSCHFPHKAFADTVDISLGVFKRRGFRNSPSLGNVGYQPYLMREGGVPTLEQQILVPIQEHAEFNHNIVHIVDSLSKRSDYQDMAQEAYGRPFDAYVLTRAIANFERSLISGWSKFDRYNRKEVNLTDKELQGLTLFESDRTQCSSCHSGFNFTSYEFANNGLAEEYEDDGRYRLTNRESDRALFKVPSLRNVALTAPYMHDGSMSSLSEVISHYNSGGFAHKNRDSRIKPLNLSVEEQEALVSFLQTLTDDIFITNPYFKQEI